MCRSSNGLVPCKPCLSCQATRHCGLKFQNYDTLFKIQEKWRNVIANHHQKWASMTFSHYKSTATCMYSNSKHVTNFQALYQTITHFRSLLSLLISFMRVFIVRFSLLGNEPFKLCSSNTLHLKGIYYHY